MPLATREGDCCSGHGCYPPRPSCGGSPDTYVNNKKLMRKGDPYVPHGCPVCRPHGGVLADGSKTVFVNNLPAGRQFDPVSCGSYANEHSPDTEIGG